MSAVAEASVRWDLTPFFPSVTSAEFLTAAASLEADVDRLAASLALVADGDPSSLCATVAGLEAVLEDARLVRGYVYLLLAADSNDSDAQRAYARLEGTSAKIDKCLKGFTAWVGTIDVDQALAAHPDLERLAYSLHKLKFGSSRLMPAPFEDLASDLTQTGALAWSKLYEDHSSNIMVDFGSQRLPMSAVRALAHDPDESTRRQAFDAELEAWKANETVLAACMNSIKGEVLLLSGKRGWPDPLASALFENNMDGESLQALNEAVESTLPEWRRFLQAKAHLLGYQGGLRFCDLFAPVAEGSEWDWERGKQFVEQGFRSFSDKLADFAARSFREQWHDVSPRPGKADGAFCADVRGDESRMLHNYKASFSGVSTLAHELGHAYHNVCLSGRTALQSETPAALAETASIFCETIIKKKMLAEAAETERLAILDVCLTGACQIVVDINSRFRFESSVFKRRANGPIGASELCGLMSEAQDATYGDGLCDRHPYMWAAKPHYYSPWTFYNFPYTFGLLFALGLYSEYQSHPEGFVERYDALLSQTGMGDAASLTAQFGIDIRSKDFWLASLGVLKADIDEFCRLAGA